MEGNCKILASGCRRRAVPRRVVSRLVSSHGSSFSAAVVVAVAVAVANWSAGLIGTPATVAGVQK